MRSAARSFVPVLFALSVGFFSAESSRAQMMDLSFRVGADADGRLFAAASLEPGLAAPIDVLGVEITAYDAEGRVVVHRARELFRAFRLFPGTGRYILLSRPLPEAGRIAAFEAYLFGAGGMGGGGHHSGGGRRAIAMDFHDLDLAASAVHSGSDLVVTFTNVATVPVRIGTVEIARFSRSAVVERTVPDGAVLAPGESVTRVFDLPLARGESVVVDAVDGAFRHRDVLGRVGTTRF